MLHKSFLLSCIIAHVSLLLKPLPGILSPPVHKVSHVQGTLGSGLTSVLISFTVSTSQASLLISLLYLLLTPNFVSFSTLPPTHGTASQLTYVKILHYPPPKHSLKIHYFVTHFSNNNHLSFCLCCVVFCISCASQLVPFQLFGVEIVVGDWHILLLLSTMWSPSTT